jgi:hypothetical protein
MHQEFDPRDLEPSLPKREERPARSKLAPILIAGVALAGFGGVVWYAYDQGVRQSGPTAATPLIKADNTPTKVRPDQPGGMDVPHQDKLVLNNLADNKSGTPSIERLLPPPESPLPRPAPTAQAPNMTPAAPPQAATPAPAANGLPPKIGPAPQQTAQVPPPAALPAPTSVAPAPTPTAPTPTASAPPPPAAAPRDAVQSSGSSGAPPAQVAAAPGAAPKPAEKPPAKPTPAAAPSATGKYKVQLVSVKAEGETKNEWARLQRTYPQLASLSMSVTRVDLGDKGIWYRIFAGPLNDAGSAGELCSALKAKGQGCVVAKP